MPESNDGSLSRLAKYRDYLHVLARMQLNPQLQGKLDASDLVQQVMLQAHVHVAQFRGGCEQEWLAWLRTILANTLAGAARQFATEGRDLKRERSLEASLEQSSSRLHWLAANHSSPSEHANRSELLLRLAAALAQLPADQKQVVEMHHLQGCTMAEVAATMRRTKPAVMGPLFRGLKTLREHLQDSDGPAS